MRQINRRDPRYTAQNLGSKASLPLYAEYGYYLLLVNATMAAAWEIDVPFLGAAGMALLAAFCVTKLRGLRNRDYLSLRVPIACAILTVMIQVLVHKQPLLATDHRNLIMWGVQLIIVQSLLLRPRFLHRFAIAAFLMGLSLLPHLNWNYGAVAGGIERAGLQGGVGYANPNELAAWFGFCCIYFLVRGTQPRINGRIAFLIVSAASLLIVGLTVSRSALGAVAIAGIIAVRHSLKRGFLPVLVLAIIGFGVVAAGVFDKPVSQYEERGVEDTGRFALWPLAIDRFLESPLLGVDEIATYVPEFNKEITPHNSFLYFALMGGIIPLALFVTYWFTAVKGAYKLSTAGIQDAPFQLPLITYVMIICSFGATGFMFPWAIVSLCNAIPRLSRGHLAVRRVRHGSALQPRESRASALIGRSPEMPPSKQFLTL